MEIQENPRADRELLPTALLPGSLDTKNPIGHPRPHPLDVELEPHWDGILDRATD